MTIKKPMSVKRPTVKADAMPSNEGVAEIPSAPAAATIADRFKLDAPDPNAKKSAASGAGTTVAVLAGVAALAVAGVLTFIIFQHWEFLKGA